MKNLKLGHKGLCNDAYKVSPSVTRDFKGRIEWRRNVLEEEGDAFEVFDMQGEPVGDSDDEAMDGDATSVSEAWSSLLCWMSVQAK